jgi:hypothetical protein
MPGNAVSFRKEGSKGAITWAFLGVRMPSSASLSHSSNEAGGEINSFVQRRQVSEALKTYRLTSREPSCLSQISKYTSEAKLKGTACTENRRHPECPWIALSVLRLIYETLLESQQTTLESTACVLY